MQPFQPMVFDNRPPVAQFYDGNPLTDGMANFASALLAAPAAEAQIRRQRAADELEQLWRQRQFDRQAQQDELARVWRDREHGLQQQQFGVQQQLAESQIRDRQADNVRQFLGMVGQGVNNAAARGINLTKALGGLFKGAGGQPRQPKIIMLPNAEGIDSPHTMGPDGRLYPVPIGPPEPAAAPQADPGWPLVPTLAAGAAGGGGLAYALAKRGAAKAPLPTPSVPSGGVAGRLGALFSRIPGAQAAGRVVGGIASLPVAIGAAGATAAYQGNQATRSDLNPMDAPAMDVIKAYAEGKNIDPGWATKFGKAITTVPSWMGGSGERTGEALDRLQEQHVNELSQALAIAIPEGDPNKGRILQQIRQDAWQNPKRAQQLVAAIYQSLAARGAQMQTQAPPETVGAATE